MSDQAGSMNYALACSFGKSC